MVIEPKLKAFGITVASQVKKILKIKEGATQYGGQIGQRVDFAYQGQKYELWTPQRGGKVVVMLAKLGVAAAAGGAGAGGAAPGGAMAMRANGAQAAQGGQAPPDGGAGAAGVQVVQVDSASK